MFDPIEVLKIVGSLTGFVAFVFLVVDRFARYRPIMEFRPPKDDDHSDTLGLAVYNTAKEAIVIDAIACSPDTSRVSFRDDWRDILDPDWKDGIAIIAPATHKVFWWHPGTNWSHQKPEDKVRITIRWSFTSSRWYWLPPVKRTVTVGRLNQIINSKPDPFA